MLIFIGPGFPMRNWLLGLVVVTAALCGWQEGVVLAGQNCLRNGCHHKLTAVRYLHGPVAAEIGGGQGCVVCHQPAGAECTPTRAGRFRTKGKDICTICHGKLTGSHHTRAAGAKCLTCHDPHGSDTSPQLLRSG